jgi:riboflavin kinase/FMN adenylyltransferase
MIVHHQAETLPPIRRAVVTIGTFDGVHRGHGRIIEQMKQEALLIDGETVIITFHPHPRKVVQGREDGLRLLTTMEERISLLGQMGIDHLVVIPFTEKFASMDAKSYISDFLVENFHPHTIIIGYDHRFGKGRSGDYHLLEEMADQFGYRVREIDAQLLDEISISSTRIREALNKGDAASARELLGYPYFFDGIVVRGDQRGRTIGYPTANLELTDADKLLPGNGVYAVQVRIIDGEFSGQTFGGMMNIGLRPTVDGQTVRTEVNLFDFDGNIYGNRLRVQLIQYIRGEERFSGLDALKEQLRKDKEAAINRLASS